MREQVEAVLDRIRPVILADGGDLELVGITPDGVVQVRLGGRCISCPMSQMTLKNGIERLVTTSVPEVTSVEAV